MKKIGMIGVGNMGGAILRGMIASGYVAAEDALVLGTSGLPVQGQVLLSAFRKVPVKTVLFLFYRHSFLLYS